MKTATLFRFKDYSQAKAFCHVLTDPIYDAIRVPSSFDNAEAHDPIQHEQKLTGYCTGVLIEFTGMQAEQVAHGYAVAARFAFRRKGMGLMTPARYAKEWQLSDVTVKQITLHDCQSHDEPEAKSNPPVKVYGRRTTKALSRLPSETETLSMEPIWCVAYRYGMSTMTWNGEKMSDASSPTKYMTRPEAMVIWRQVRDKYKDLYGPEVARRITIARKWTP